MAKDPYADLAAKYGVGETTSDNYDDLAAKYGVGQKPVPSPVTVAGLNAGPEARRAAAGMSPGPRTLTDEEAGVASGPVKAPPPSTADRLDSAKDSFLRRHMTPKSFEASGQRYAKNEGELAEDPIAQMVATSAVLGPAGRAATSALRPVLGRVAVPLVSAAEGGAASKSMGGDFATGAVLGGAIPAAAAVKNVIAEGAPARVAARIERNLGENAKQRTADKIRAVAKKGDLAEVIDRNPELRKPLAIQAKEKPAEALQAVQEAKARSADLRDEMFEKMQEHFADKPPSAQASISGILDDYDKLLKQNPADLDRQAVLNRARFEITQLGDRLREAQGLPPAKGDYSGTVLSPNDLRDLERTIGGRAYEMGTPTSVKRKVNAELYKPLSRQMNALAEATPGVDAKEFAGTGKDIHVLIPVEESLQTQVDRAASGKATLGERLKSAAHGVAHVAGLGAGYAAHGPVGAVIGAAVPAIGRAALKSAEGLGRRIDYSLAEGVRAGGVPRLREPFAPALPAAAVATENKDQGYAAKVLEGLRSGKSLAQSVELAEEH